MSERFEEILLAKGIVTPDQLHIALIEQEKQKDQLGDILIDLKFVAPSVVGNLMSQVSGYDYIDLLTFPIENELIAQFGKEFCERYQVIPFSLNESLHVAMLDPENVMIQDLVKKRSRELLKNNAAWTFHYTNKISLMQALKQTYQTSKNVADATFEKFFVNILNEAFSRNASDIDFVPLEKMVLVKFRIYGELEIYQHIEKVIFDKILVRFKILSHLDITERRRPQSGGCILTIHDTQVDCRVSFHPCLWRESLVVRLLSTNRDVLILDNLGFSKKQAQVLRNLVKNPSGLFLICGPTGSGKTTTLHALIQLYDHVKKNIMTLEQPIEYRVDGIRQTEIKEGGVLDFAEGVRSMLRHDPDILLIGEIRDENTAKIALRASMTGHLVLATLHASCPFTVPARLIDLGISPSLLSGQILAVLNQELISFENKRKAIGQVVIFTDEMHNIVSQGGDRVKLRDLHMRSTGKSTKVLSSE